MSNGQRTVYDVLRAVVSESPDAQAIIDVQRRELSYASLLEEVEELAAQLSSVEPREGQGRARIGIALPNGVNICLAMLASAIAGTAVPFNPSQTQTEFEQQFSQTKVDAVIVPDGVDSAATDAANQIGIPVLRLAGNRVLNGLIGNEGRPCRYPAPDDVALVLMTSGSTGRPKIVPLTHRNICKSASEVSESLELRPEDTCLVMWEQYHIGGLVDLLLAPIAAGSKIIPAGSFDASLFFELLDSHRPTWFQGVPTTLWELVVFAEKHGNNPSRPQLRFVRSVAAALAPAQLERVQGAFDVPVIRTLGMTEAGPLIATTPLDPAWDKPGSVGASVGTEIAILDDQGDQLATGQTGQIAIRGENVFSGYEGNPEANLASFRNGWFLTGDLGYLDADGDLFLSGRIKSMINRGGEKISPQEVEEALLEHPSVHEAAVFAVEHATLGEDVACAVVLSAPSETVDLRDFLASRLSKFKIPGQFELTDQLPRNPVGKIDRLALQARVSGRAAQKNGIIPPRTENEILLAEIWKRELALPEVGVDQDFIVVNGDSLSAVRILVELEMHFGCPMPDTLVENFTTIAEIAAILDAHSLRPRNEDTTRDKSSKASAREVHSERVVFSGQVDDAVRSITVAKSRAELRLIVEHIFAHLTPSEAATIIARISAITPGAEQKGTTNFQRYLMKKGLDRWLSEANTYLDAGVGSRKWQKETIREGAMLYNDPGVNPSAKTLVVGFCGNRMRLLMPTFRVLASLDPSKTDLLLLLDKKKRLFRDGIEGIGNDVTELAGFLRKFSSERGYSRVVGLGTSGGSLAVLATSTKAGFSVAVSAAAAPLDKHPEWLADLRAAAEESENSGKPRLKIIHGRRISDQNIGMQLAGVFPNAEVIRYPHAQKNIFPEAQRRGELAELLEYWLA